MWGYGCFIVPRRVRLGLSPSLSHGANTSTEAPTANSCFTIQVTETHTATHFLTSRRKICNSSWSKTKPLFIIEVVAMSGLAMYAITIAETLKLEVDN